MKPKRKKSPALLMFKAFLVENNIGLKELSELLGLTISSVSQKNNGYQLYTIKEMNIICDYYGISAELFRYKKVS
ncbi:MAG TPA: hypothetical protein VIK34_05665 [Clostridiaceae bacterium]